MSKALATAVAEKSDKKPRTLSDQVRDLTPQISRLVGPRLADRMARQAESLLRQDSKLAQCSPLSYLGAVMNSAAIGLEPGPMGLVYFVPFKNGKTGQTDVTFIVSAKGWMQLVRNSGKLLNIDAKCVYENDTFEYEYGFEPKLVHKPALNNRGKIIAVYAVAQLKDGGRQLEVMSVEDIEKVRKSSRASATGPWVEWYDQMCIKTVLKRICKLLPLSSDVQKAMAYDETVNTLTRVEDNFGNTLPLPIKSRDLLVDMSTGEVPMDPDGTVLVMPGGGEGVDHSTSDDSDLFGGEDA